MERRYYTCIAEQTNEPCSNGKWLTIKLWHFKVIRSRRGINDPFVYDETTGVAVIHVWIEFPFVKVLSYFSAKEIKKVLSYRTKCRRMIRECLSTMGVPEDEHPNIVEETFKVVEAAVSPELPVCVYILDVTERTSLDPVHDRVTMESMETYRPDFVAATKSSIEGLEKVRLEEHGLELEAITRQTPSCVICMKGLGRRRRRRRRPREGEGGGGGGSNKKNKRPMITLTRLPCLHHFHRRCIVRWLDISHMCPMCRHPMPTMEVDPYPS